LIPHIFLKRSGAKRAVYDYCRDAELKNALCGVAHALRGEAVYGAAFF